MWAPRAWTDDRSGGRASGGDARLTSASLAPVKLARAGLERRRRRRAQRSTIVLSLLQLRGRHGVCRAVTNLANAFAEAGLDVTVLVLLRRGKPTYPLDERVRVQYVRDMRPRAAERLNPQQTALDARPGRLGAVDEHLTALTERLLRRALRRLGPCTLITNRPVLHQAAALWAPDHVLKVAFEHTTYDSRTDAHRAAIRESLPRLDRLVVLVDENRDHWASYLGSEDKLTIIPNIASFAESASLSPCTAPVVVAAGNLIPRKGFDRLIRSFAPVARELPDWELRIFGDGPERSALEAIAREEGVEHQVRLMGYTRSLEEELRSSSIFALSSHSEGLALVLLEAMNAGLPIVAFECTGTRQAVAHERTGLVVHDDDLPGMTDALRRLMVDPELRATWGRASHELGRAYDPDAVVGQWRALIDELT